VGDASLLILGSASPRRAQLLRACGLAFRIVQSEVDESLPERPGGIEPEEAALLLAERKARAVAERFRGEDAIVLAADTIVAVGGPDARADTRANAGANAGDRAVDRNASTGARLLGKPIDAHDAARMLEQLSGSRHRVVTGVAALHVPSGRIAAGYERTWVTMRPIGADEIAAYVESGEWRDKAGGYAIQENADRFVTGLEEGGFDNVVGLPVALTLRLVERARSLADAPGRG
jgi:septum formation protein